MSEKIHTIDGVKYREVERKAKVGEMIIYVACRSGIGVNTGDIILANRVNAGGYVDAGNGAINPKNYRVLEQITDAEPASPALLDLIAKLTTKVMALESEVAALRALSDSNSADIALLDERTQPLTEFAKYYGGERQ